MHLILHILGPKSEKTPKLDFFGGSIWDELDVRNERAHFAHDILERIPDLGSLEPGDFRTVFLFFITFLVQKLSQIEAEIPPKIQIF